MAVFDNYIPLLLQVEGDYQAHSADAGNYNSKGHLVGTQYGISARFYESVTGRPPTVADIKAITKAQAVQLYKTHFWDALRASEINSQPVANTVVDHHVNAGTGARLAQQVLNRNFGFALAVDNKIGQQTLNALNSVNAADFVERYNAARADYYRSLSNSSAFINGWLERLKSFAVEHKTKIMTVNTVLLIGLVGLMIYKMQTGKYLIWN